MKIAALSDFHMGFENGMDRFGHKETEFLEVLKRLEQKYERVILLGDIYETLYSVLPFDFTRAYHQAKRAHGLISDYLTRPSFTVLSGNHDAIATKEEDIPVHLEIAENGFRMLFLHGNSLDNSVRGIPKITSLAAWSFGWLRRMGWRGAPDFLGSMHNLLTGIKPIPEKCRFVSWAIEKARKEGYRIIVTGHVHFPSIYSKDGVLFLNTGACIYGRLEFMEIDTDAQTASLFISTSGRYNTETPVRVVPFGSM